MTIPNEAGGFSGVFGPLLVKGECYFIALVATDDYAVTLKVGCYFVFYIYS
jgi:hypothetical protein